MTSSHTPAKPSKTAIYTTGYRTYHRKFEGGSILDDKYAHYFLEGFWLFVATRKWLYQLVTRIIGLEKIRGQVLIRARFCEDQIAAATREKPSLKQCVLVGAGYDTVAMRLASLPITFFEIDRPAIQARKQALIAKHRLKSRAHFIASNFEANDLAERLLQAGFDPAEKSIFTFFGVTYYLSRDEIRQGLQSLHKIMSPESCVLVDYGLDLARLDAETQSYMRKMQKLVAKCGEPIVSLFTPEDFAQLAHEAGYRVASEVTPDDMRKNYLKQTQVPFSGFSHFAILQPR
ncbi:MAG: SAM-dependent methyltransferase [Candidatus Symbiobacter sp.]|nr:SAM-dependent methyltransferase [Candidatus Symbiobacter sp.]